MRSFLLLVAALALSAEAPPPEVSEFDQALAASHPAAATAAIDNLIARRTPADGKPRPDTLLNALLGRFLMTEGDGAGLYLDKAPVSELPVSLRPSTALAHGKSLERRGDRPSALKAYREALAASTNDLDRRRAAFGIARQLLPDDPAAARAELVGIANTSDSPNNWQTKFLLALASSLQGNAVAAAVLADQVWAEAANAPLTDLAPLHAATLKAGLAAARHDQGAERAMLTAANGLTLSASPLIADRLPVCGEGGVLPSDFVIFGYVEGPFTTRHLFPVAASRPEIVAKFDDALSGMSVLKDAKRDVPVGTVFTVYCRTVVAAGVADMQARNDLLAWFIDQGIYPGTASNDADDAHVNGVSERVDALAARYGKGSPILLGAQWQLLTLLERRAREGDTVLPGQLTDLANQIASGMRRAGAPEWMAATIERRREYQRISARLARDPSLMREAEARARELLLGLPFATARDFLGEMLDRVEGDWPPSAARLVIAVNGNAPAALNKHDRQAWLQTVGHAYQLLGQQREARATLESAGLEKDVCVMADSPPKVLAQPFSYSDYPGELIAGNQEGSTTLELDLSASGSVVRRRVIASFPSGIFDQLTMKGASQIRYTAPARSGRAASCRAIVQSINWRIADDDDGTPPTLTSEPQGPIS